MLLLFLRTTILPRFGLAALGALSLAACAPEGGSDSSDAAASSDEGSDESAAPPERLAMAETAWLSVSRDGAVFTTYLDRDGRYRDLRAGAVAFAGTWEQNAEGRICFEPDAGNRACWEHGAPDKSGSVRMTASDGRAIIVKRVTYTMPAILDADDTSHGSGDGPEDVASDSGG
ncbi:MAG: hypothetical protein WBA51_00235 [Erythrobacter sp.]